MPDLVRALKVVDLPTLGRPTMPHWRLMVDSGKYCASAKALLYREGLYPPASRMIPRMSDTATSPLRDAVLAQIAGALMAFSLVWLGRAFIQLPLFHIAVLQGICAALVSWRCGAPRWWWLINLL